MTSVTVGAADEPFHQQRNTHLALGGLPFRPAPPRETDEGVVDDNANIASRRRAICPVHFTLTHDPKTRDVYITLNPQSFDFPTYVGCEDTERFNAIRDYCGVPVESITDSELLYSVPKDDAVLRALPRTLDQGTRPIKIFDMAELRQQVSQRIMTEKSAQGISLIVCVCVYVFCIVARCIFFLFVFFYCFLFCGFCFCFIYFCAWLTLPNPKTFVCIKLSLISETNKKNNSFSFSSLALQSAQEKVPRAGRVCRRRLAGSAL